MYAVVRTYEMAEDWDDTLLRHLTEEFVPTIEKLAGFVSYHALQAGERLFCSVTIFENRDGAAESNRLAAEYVQRHLADRFATSPEITSGEVVASRTA
jgi:hypothetical protein